MRNPETKMSPATAATARGTKAQHNTRISERSGTPERNTTDARRALKQARRTLGAALAQGEPHADLVAAAGLVIEAAGGAK